MSVARVVAVVLDAVAPHRTRTDLRAIAAAARGIAGHKVIFTRQPNGHVFNGSLGSGKNSTYVLIDVDSTIPVMAVLGHEILHRLWVQNPAICDKLNARLETLLRNEDHYRARLDRAYKAAKLQLLGEGKMREELVADR